MEFIEKNEAAILWNLQRGTAKITELLVTHIENLNRSPWIYDHYTFSGGRTYGYWEEINEVTKILDIFRMIYDGFVDNEVRKESLLQLTRIIELKSFRDWVFTRLSWDTSYEEMMEKYFPDEDPKE